MNSKITKNDKLIMIAMYVAFCIVSVFFGAQLSVPLVIDEVGTVANTAFLAGDDWSMCVQSMGGFYYKYGLSIVYLPIYMLFRSQPILMYKAIMALHMVMMSVVPVIAYYICRRFLNVDSWKKSIMLAVAGGGIPSLWLYAMYSRADVVLIVFPWVLLLVILMLNECTETKKKALLSALLAFVMVYVYMAHSRGIVLVIATVMTVLILPIMFKKHLVNYFTFVPVSVVLLVIDKFVSKYVKYGVYGEYGTKRASVENFDFDTFMKIFTPKGFMIEVRLWIGWLYNLFASSYGLMIIGMLAGFVFIFKAIRLRIKKQENGDVSANERVLSIFTVLCALGTYFMGTLYFFPHAWKLMTGLNVTRADRMIYGRYTVGSVGPICLLALYVLICRKDEIVKLKSKIASVVLYIVTLLIFTVWVCPALEGVPSTNARYFLSLTTFLKIEKSLTSAPFYDLTEALFKAGAVAFVVMIAILICTHVSKKRVNYIAIAVVIVVSAANFGYVFTNVRNDRDNLVAKRIENIVFYTSDIKGVDEVAEEYPAVFKSTTASLVKFYQFAMPKFNVGKIGYIRNTDQKEFIIITKKKKIVDAIAESEAVFGKDNYYTFVDFDYKHAERDVMFVKGDNLAKLLESKGNKLELFVQ